VSHRLLVKDARGERELLLIDTILVGRDPRCDISEPDAQLSRRHAEFSVSERGVVVRDLNSRNGMLVNGRRILETVLHPGDVVQVGNLAVTFLRAAAEPDAVSMPPAEAPPRSGPSSRPRRTADGQPVLPFRPQPEEDDRTSLMAPEDVAAAAIASLSDRPRIALEPDRSTVDAPAGAGTVAAAAGPWSAPASEAAWPPAAPAPASAPPARPKSPLGAAAPLVEKGPLPITGLAEPAWAASVTWHVATLAIVAFLVGAVSVLPWTAAVARGGPAGGIAVLLVPLVALAAALGLGLVVAARVRRTLSHAINAVLDRAGRP
jgi:hypothetical protein